MSKTKIGKIICDYCIADECPSGCHRDEPRCAENQSQVALILKAHNAVIKGIEKEHNESLKQAQELVGRLQDALVERENELAVAVQRYAEIWR